MCPLIRSSFTGTSVYGCILSLSFSLYYDVDRAREAAGAEGCCDARSGCPSNFIPGPQMTTTITACFYQCILTIWPGSRARFPINRDSVTGTASQHRMANLYSRVAHVALIFKRPNFIPERFGREPPLEVTGHWQYYRNRLVINIDWTRCEVRICFL